MSGPSGRSARWLLPLGIAVHLVFLVSLFTGWLDGLFVEAVKSPGQAADWFGIYQGGRNLLDGLSIYDSEQYRNEAERVVPYFYFYRYLPPTAYGTAAMAAFLSPWASYWVWIALNEILLAAFVISILRIPVGTALRRVVLATIVLAFSPFYLEQWMGQFSFLMAILIWITVKRELVLGATRALDGTFGSGGRVDPEREAGVSRSLRRFDSLRDVSLWGFAGAVALKTYPALYAVSYWREGRRKRVLIAAGIVALACLPYFLLRPEDVLQFVRLNLRPLPAEIELARYGMTPLIQALSTNFLGERAGETVNLLGKRIYLSSVPVYCWILGVMGTAFLVAWRRRPTMPDAIALWTAAFFCIYKDIWEYHHVMLLPVIVTLALRHRSVVPLLVGVLLALPTPFALYADTYGVVPVETWPWPLILLHYGVKTLPVLGLFLWTVRICGSAGADSGESRPSVRAGAGKPESRGLSANPEEHP